MRFLADMGISPGTVQHLCECEHDAIHLREEGLQRLPDKAVLEKARTENRVLLTADLDFGYLLAISGEIMPSVILFRLSDMRPQSLSEHLDRIIELHIEEERGQFIVVTDTGIRVRKLPIGESSE